MTAVTAAASRQDGSDEKKARVMSNDSNDDNNVVRRWQQQEEDLQSSNGGSSIARKGLTSVSPSCYFMGFFFFLMLSWMDPITNLCFFYFFLELDQTTPNGVVRILVHTRIGIYTRVLPFRVV